MNPQEATRQVIHEDMHRATLPEVGIENMGHTEFPAMLGEELYLQRLAQEGNPHRKRDPHTLESSDPITQALYRTGKHSDVPKEQQDEYIRNYAKRKNPRTLKMVIVKAPLYDTVTGKQVAGVPTPAPKDDPNFDFEYDYSNQGTVQPNKRFLYQSPNQKVRAIVESNTKNETATIPIFATHHKERGKGHGRQALRNLNTEVRSIHPNVKDIEPTGVTAEAEPFWEKMNDEGLVSYEGYMPPIPNIDRDTGEPIERSNPRTLKMVMAKEQKKLFVQGQQTLDGQPAFLPTDFEAAQERRVAELNAINEKEARRQKLIEQAKTLGMTTPLHQYFPSVNKD